MALGWLWWRAWVPVDAVDAAAFGVAGRGTCAFCVAGMALGDMDVHFAWQAWHLWRAWVPVDAVDAVAFCMAGAALGDMDLHFAWQAWHLVRWTCALRGRRRTYGTGLALVARLGPS